MENPRAMIAEKTAIGSIGTDTGKIIELSIREKNNAGMIDRGTTVLF